MDTIPARKGKKRRTVKNPEVRLARSDELAEVCRLAWRCYGFTQEEFLYDLQSLTEKIENGEFKSVIGIDPENGAIFGHAGFKYHDPSVKVPELGLVFVDPAYRSPRVGPMMTQLLFDMARSEDDKGIFDCSVTTHFFSQKGLQELMGSRPCCLMLGIAASGMQAKELATSKQEKGSVVNHYYAIDRTQKTVFIPPRHQEMVADIYRWMEVPREFGVPDMEPPTGASSVSLFSLPDELNAAFIIVHSIGADTVKEIDDGLQRYRADRMDAVYLFLPSCGKAAAYLIEQCERLRFFFAGVMPHVHDGHDRVLMQYVDIPLNMDAIRVYGDMSRQLKAYVMKEQGRVQELR
ncbi:GNAT family N-acetyltransferase [uncultured Pseudodesulfovibrio sp.]|uniref:GNAT family N-acetyltransferase n=1 Tax=uncultured Pseudodesulfovibrio sp. TaxID=2035858 RepID=UPI0029C5FBD1|nr:GNAT family N-acetyltransferase [uncultured Pseudodesulfovibrio sp.]